MAEQYPAAIPLHLLPTSVRRLVDLIGLAPTLRLLEARGGAYIDVPKPCNLDADHPLVAIVGWDAAVILAGEFQGDRLSVAKACGALRAVRNAAICHDYYILHKSQAALALAYRLDVRSIREIVNRTELTTAQLDLFEATS